MSLPIVQLDVDGVLADFVHAALCVMRSMGYDLSSEHVVEWDMSRLLPEDRRDEFWSRLKAQGFCSSIPLVDGAVAFVHRLLPRFDVRFLTSPAVWDNPYWEAERRDWLQRHFSTAFGHPEPPVAFAHDKHAHPGDFLVDDKVEHCAEWARTGRPAVLLSMPHNMGFDAAGTDLWIFRADDLGDAAEWLEVLADDY